MVVSCQKATFAATFRFRYLNMKKQIFLSLFAGLTLCLAGCGEYNAVLKHGDAEYKYEVAKACFVKGQYGRAADLLSELLPSLKGTGYAQECLYMLGMSTMLQGDDISASTYFKRYCMSHPRGSYAAQAHFNSCQALYNSVLDPRLDQTTTHQALLELQGFVEQRPTSPLRDRAQEMIQELQDHLLEKEYRSAKLYYDLGSYLINCAYGGSNYEACIITSNNALRDYPYASETRREQFAILILRSRYHLARQSVEEKRNERYRETIDEYYAFKGEFPESSYLNEAEGYFNRSQRALRGQPEEDD